MSNAARNIARKLSKIQHRLRSDLLDELKDHEEELETIFDPYSFSPVTQELKEKYLNRLYIIQALVQQLAHHNQGRKQPPVKVLSVRAEKSEELVSLVNKKLARLNGAKVMDVEFLQNKQEDQDDDSWVAVITYKANPFLESQGETAAFM
ncbi:MAG: hypothetical protein KGZ25_03335 [Planctomycetes bacterium]|nr:hypothetical protein [Planctomycetota bacterium]